MKTIPEILDLIQNKDISDKTVREEIEALGTSPTTSEAEKIFTLLEQERSDLYQEWKLEIATSYM